MVLLAVVCEVLGRAFFRAGGFSIAVRATWLGAFRVEVVGSAAFYRGSSGSPSSEEAGSAWILPDWLSVF